MNMTMEQMEERLEHTERQLSIALDEVRRLEETGVNLRVIYNAIVELKEQLESNHHDPELGCPEYRKIKALAACYELQDYLANRIAQAVYTGELPEDPED